MYFKLNPSPLNCLCLIVAILVSLVLEIVYILLNLTLVLWQIFLPCNQTTSMEVFEEKEALF